MSVCLSGLNLQTLCTNVISLFSQLLPQDSNEIKERLNLDFHIFRLRKSPKKFMRCKATVVR